MDNYEIIALVVIAVFAVPVLYLVYFVGRTIVAAISDYRNRDERKQDGEAFERMVEAVKSIPLADAKDRADALFSQSTGFSRSAPTDTTPIPSLSPGLQEFFALYGEITAEGGEVVISRQDIQPYEHDRAFIWLGRDGVHTQLTAKPGEDAVYVLADDVPKAQQVEDHFPSIYHYLLFVDRRGKEAGGG